MNRMPDRTLGTTGVHVSIVGIGGGGLGHNPQIIGTPQRWRIRALAEPLGTDAGNGWFL